ncbi:MAG: hypothetical protein V1872_06210 [bacterium]
MMRIKGILKNKRGGVTLLWVLITIILLMLGLFIWFIIQSYRDKRILNKYKFLVNRYAAFTTYRKYAYLIKNGNPDNWRAIILKDFYDFVKCSDSTGDNCTHCRNQEWRLAKLPYKIMYSIDGQTFNPIPDRISYSYDGTLTDKDSGINSNDWKCLRISNEKWTKCYLQILLKEGSKIEADIMKGELLSQTPIDISIVATSKPLLLLDK